MKNFIVSFVVLFSFCFNLHAGKIEVLPGRSNDLKITENTWLTFSFSHITAEIRTLDVKAEGRDFTQMLMAGYSRTGIIGSPELPVRRELLEVPLNAVVRLEITQARYTDLDLAELGYPFPIMPAQAPAIKSEERHDFDFDAKAYQVDAFTPGDLVTFEILGTMRSYRIGRLDIHPVHYNPVTHTLRVYDLIEASIYFEQADIPATLALKEKYENFYFRNIGKTLLNSQPPAGRDTVVSYPITYLIVSDPMFEAQLQPFIQWKTKQGYHVIAAYTNDPQVGTSTTAIKNYIQGQYNNPAPGKQPPSFCLLVGDIQQIPAWNGVAGSHVTDLYYFEYTGDIFPEMYYGRFSAQNTTQLQPQIDKTIQYEKYTMPDPTYLNEVVMVAGMDGSYGSSHANGQINYGTINYFNTANGILSHTYMYPSSGGQSAAIIQNISDGVTYGNYTAHCGPNGWSDPSFTTSNIPSLQNQDKYGLLVGNCCQSSKFNENECFAEALLRAENKGAVGYIGASNNTYWNEDYYWAVGVGQIAENPPPYEETTLGMYDRAFHTHGEPWEDWYATASQHIYAGNLAVTLGVPNSSTYYWEAYCLMGDPSLMVYYSQPQAMNVSYIPLMPLNSTSFTVQADPYAYVGISLNGELKGAALADASGIAVVPLDPITTPGTADIVVTAQNRQPFFGTVIAANPEGPFILVNDHSWQELSGYPNNKIEPGEVIGINIELINYGMSAGTDVVATLSTMDEYVTITDAYEYCGDIGAQSTQSYQNAFSVIIADYVPNGHEVKFIVTTQDLSRESWSSNITLGLSAPVLKLNSLTVDDSQGGNGNGRMDPGETVNLIATFSNEGNAIGRNTLASLTAHSGFVNILNPEQTIGNFPFFGNTPVIFQAEIDSKAPEGILAHFAVNLVSGAYELNEVCPMKIGLICEDFETGDFSKFPWNHGGDMPWTITNVFPHQGFYCIRSGNIDHLQSSEISVHYQVMQPDSISFYRKVSSASGDRLQFLINGQVAGEWSGTIGGWKRESYYVGAGNHTFKWIYVKDGSGTAGSDAAWIDYIVFPPKNATTLYAGEDATICPAVHYQCQGQATNFQSVSWNTSGTGIFNNNHILSPQYTPSSDDLEAGQVMLTMNIIDSQGEAFHDEMTLSFSDTPVQPDMPDGPEEVNIDINFVSDYSVSPVEDAMSYQWIVNPAEAGFFAGTGTTVTLVWNRDFGGVAMIGVEAVNDCGISPASPELMVIVENSMVNIPETRSASLSVTAYPNPVKDMLYIRISGEINKKMEICLVNLLGMKIVTKEVYHTGETVGIHVDHLQPGIYLLSVVSDDRMATRKIMIR